MSNKFKLKIVQALQRLYRGKYKLNLEFRRSNQVIFGAKSLEVYEPKVWIFVPFHIKTQQL